MAIHNSVTMLGFVRSPARVKEDDYGGTAAYCPVSIVRGTRDNNDRFVADQFEVSTPVVMSEEKDVVDKMKTWQEYDVVFVKGFIATREVEKKAQCPECGEVNTRREAAVGNHTLTGGNIVYVYPIYAELLFRAGSQEEAYREVKRRAEISNVVTLVGNLTREPVHAMYTDENGRGFYFTRYQVAINRKYCAKGMDEISERTDYPWIYSYGDKSEVDAKVLRTGSQILVDGAIQTRKYTEKYVCPHCGKEYNYEGKMLEILSYDTEYFLNCDFEEYEEELAEKRAAEEAGSES